MMAYSEDQIALAAEYALGTLDADERAQAETMMSVDKEFAAMVEAWQHKLGALNQMVGSVEPRPEIWNKIKSAISLSEAQAALVLPEAPTLRTVKFLVAASTVRMKAGAPPSFCRTATYWSDGGVGAEGVFTSTTCVRGFGRMASGSKSG